jgi:hypothetical protein
MKQLIIDLFQILKCMVVMPEADFFFDGTVDYDDTDIGLKQLVSYDGHEIETSIRGLLGYQFSPIKRLEIATFMGAGLIYYQRSGAFLWPNFRSQGSKLS